MARSMSPTIYSDYGSEWTLPVNVEDGRATAQSRQSAMSPTDLAHAQFLQIVHDKMFGRSLTSQSFVVRPNTPADSVFDVSRPRTALPHFNNSKEASGMNQLLKLKNSIIVSIMRF